MSEKLRVGILGAGWAGGGHANAFSGLPNVEIAALWSRTRTHADVLASQLNESSVKIYDDWRELVEKAEVDVISLATPSILRRDPLLMALEQGCHVLVEKPITVGLTDVDTIAHAAKQTDMVTATVFNWRYSPGNQAAKRAIENRQIGNILDVSLEWRDADFPREFVEQRPWIKDFDQSDGILGEAVSHDLDCIRFLTGCDFKQVVSQLVSRSLPLAPEIEVAGGTSIMLAELTKSILADIRYMVTAGLPERSLIISGETGTLKVTHETTVQQRLGESEAITLETPVSDQVPNEVDLMQYSWNRLIADFVTAIQGGDKAHATVPNLPSLDDGLKVQQVISAVHLSNKERRWVALNELV
ncbi:Gfo/Idh/MocA family protein [Candidatus Leptofilum sp.]|uniref:Gfo/Idh/MocA family protein n=1 Tax=Candidatus Leptofilum sp. TaxID=3241576 RepID=UPI003B5CE4CA